MAEFESIAVIGLGLIGSSIARAVNERGIASKIIGSDVNEVSLAYARKNGFITNAMPDAGLAAASAQLVILAVPPAALGSLAAQIGPHLKAGSWVMDTASVKIPAIEAIAPHIPSHVTFIPAHPIAGSEKSGVSAGRANLFDGKRVIITPAEPLSPEYLQTINHFWQGLGAKVEAMPAELHDMVYGYVSHLPQLLAFAMAPFYYCQEKDELLQRFLRLSHSDATLWAEIFLLNKINILKSLDRYLDVISHIQQELENAPESAEATLDSALVKDVLLPRIVASCLVTTVMEAEKRAGFSFARYAGSGFNDIISPIDTPEETMEQVSTHYKNVSLLLDTYRKNLKALREAIGSGSTMQLLKTLQKR